MRRNAISLLKKSFKTVFEDKCWHAKSNMINYPVYKKDIVFQNQVFKFVMFQKSYCYTLRNTSYITKCNMASEKKNFL